jgi:DNA-binding transcriptional MerR regulator
MEQKKIRSPYAKGVIHMLTIKEISKRLQIPESTLRWYRDKFSDYLPASGEGRQKRYSLDSLNVFRFIASAMREGKTVAEVAVLLSGEFPSFIDVSNESNVVSVTTTQVPAPPVNPIAEHYLTLYAQQEQRITQLERMVINAGEQAIAAREEAIAAKEYIDTRLNERDRVLMGHIRSLQDKRPWWKFWR